MTECHQILKDHAELTLCHHRKANLFWAHPTCYVPNMEKTWWNLRKECWNKFKNGTKSAYKYLYICIYTDLSWNQEFRWKIIWPNSIEKCYMVGYPINSQTKALAGVISLAVFISRIDLRVKTDYIGIYFISRWLWNWSQRDPHSYYL